MSSKTVIHKIRNPFDENGENNDINKRWIDIWEAQINESTDSSDNSSREYETTIVFPNKIEAASIKTKLSGVFVSSIEPGSEESTDWDFDSSDNTWTKKDDNTKVFSDNQILFSDRDQSDIEKVGLWIEI